MVNGKWKRDRSAHPALRAGMENGKWQMAKCSGQRQQPQTDLFTIFHFPFSIRRVSGGVRRG
jgi:hypothetical protein